MSNTSQKERPFEAGVTADMSRMVREIDGMRGDGQRGEGATCPMSPQKPNCVCKADPPRLHGPYFRWTVTVDGKRTTKTISAKTARECERRIKYYRQLQRAVEKLAQAAMKSPPRNQAPRRIASKNQATSRSRKDVGN